jgi:hypothetical protein
MIARASSEIWRAPSQAKELLAQDGAQSGEDGGSPRTIYRRGPLSALPESFERVSSSDRIAEICRWEHDTLRPKYPLLDHIGLAESSSSLPRADRETFWRVARRQGAEANLPHIAALRLAGVDYVLSPLSVNDGGRDESPDKEVRSAAVPLTSVLSPLPDAWVVHHVASLPPMAANASTAELERRTREVLFANGAPRDFLASAVVEATNPPRFSEPALSALPNGSCQVVERSPQRMRIEANLPRPGLLVVNLPYDGGWKARTPGSNAGPLAILRTNRILQGVALPAGTHTLELTYEPASFRVGAAVSLIAWLLLGAMMIGRVVKRFRSGS